MTQIDNHEAIELGRTATVVAGAVAEYIHLQESNIISRILSSYRAKTLTHDEMMGAVGELAGLRGLMGSLESDQRRGNTAATREFVK